MSDSKFAVMIAAALVLIAGVTGYALASYPIEPTVECSVTFKDGSGNKHVWLTRCDR